MLNRQPISSHVNMDFTMDLRSDSSPWQIYARMLTIGTQLLSRVIKEWVCFVSSQFDRSSAFAVTMLHTGLC